LHNEEIYNLHSSSDIIEMIKSRRIRRPDHVASMEGKCNTNLVARPEGNTTSRNIRLKWILNTG
jgi:hypothetical protein